MTGVQIKILYVEDEPIVRRLIYEVFARRGFRVRTATNGREGVEIALAWLPDLVVMDLMMPEMDGFEATAVLRANPSTQSTPIIGFSAVSPRSVEERLRESGMNAWVSKSDSNRLVHAVRAYLPPDKQWPCL